MPRESSTTISPSTIRFASIAVADVARCWRTCSSSHARVAYTWLAFPRRGGPACGSRPVLFPLSHSSPSGALVRSVAKQGSMNPGNAALRAPGMRPFVGADRRAPRPMVNDQMQDSHRLQRALHQLVPRCGRVMGDDFASIGVRTFPDAILLHYTWTSRQHKPLHINCGVELTQSPCHYGGWRQ
jgi:hypothetical protein